MATATKPKKKKPTAAQLREAKEQWPGISGEALRLAALGEPPPAQRAKAENGRREAERKARSEAAKKAGAIKNLKGAKGARKKAAGSFSPEIEKATEIARRAGGSDAAPSRNHVKAIAKLIGKGDPIKQAGVSVGALRAYACEGERPEDPAGLRDLARRANVAGLNGRRLAAALYGLREARKAAS